MLKNMLEILSKLFTLENIVGITAILGVFFTIYSKRKPRPSMSTAEYINDEYGRRLLFTIISTNPNGSAISKKPLKVEKLPHKIFRHKKIFYLNSITNKDFLNPKIHYDSIPNWLIKGQESFVATLNDNQLTEEGNYKLTFYTSDGSCSQTLTGYFGLLSQLFERELKD
ncbi:MAG: hypothetical protein M0Q21_05850 [Ignavibacteriaceae bacterium]|nr:hypothetical protein [Ignavibacteriaceae bacterium]